MDILLPNDQQLAWSSIVQDLLACHPLPPFHSTTIRFIDEVSRTILLSKSHRRFPELLSMAHWMRGFHLQEIKQNFETKRNNRILVPRGLVLHFAPSNVDSIFMYSWFVSLLVGNKNMIRLSRNRTEQMTLLLTILNNVLIKDEFSELRKRVVIISYEHNDTITRELSSLCDVRVIWGGDETIRQIRSIPLPPNATELCFTGKFSICAIHAATILDSTDEDLNQLVQKFMNDAFWFDQLACSSPKLVIWIGEQDQTVKAKARFWNLVKNRLDTTTLHWGSEVGITRMITGYSYALQGLGDQLSTSKTDLPYRVHITSLTNEIREKHCGGGLFLEMELPSLFKLIPLLTRKDQTLAVFGFDREELRSFATQLGGYGIDRIVEVGHSLDFQLTWDGYDLLLYLTREITIE
ncbi:acyl-CoA reductase [Brevibacillus ginsengisoli]|uniref:acyl-CoA reductase n=1 Tax=Brevibacillus ginsengisoli TaxID=363854 RepID=UPI003CED7A77